MIGVERIRELIPEPALYEQLAEECSELAQACLKKARKLRNENYTPKTMVVIDANITEEYTDIQLVSHVCGIFMDWSMARKKADRWIKRNEQKEKVC